MTRSGPGPSGLQAPVVENRDSLPNTGMSRENLMPTQVKVLFLVVNRPGRDVNHKPLNSSVDENDWSYKSAPPVYRLDVALHNFTYWPITADCSVSSNSVGASCQLVRRQLNGNAFCPAVFFCSYFHGCSVLMWPASQPANSHREIKTHLIKTGQCSYKPTCRRRKINYILLQDT
jgi:hypothetical protein